MSAHVTALRATFCVAVLATPIAPAHAGDGPPSRQEDRPSVRTTTDIPEGDSVAARQAVEVSEPAHRWAPGENLRMTVDLSSRIGLTRGGGTAYQHVIGLDSHKVISGEGGDWGTVVMQGYLTRIDNQAQHPPFFDGADDTQFVYRIVNLNLTRYGRGRFNVRVGHFEIPFGLEHVINTNGTLRDFMHGPNLGVKADWGAGVNGSFPIRI